MSVWRYLLQRNVSVETAGKHVSYVLSDLDGVYDCRGMVERAVIGSERIALVQRDADSDMLMRRRSSGEQCKRKGGQCSWKEHGCPSGLKECGC